MSVSFIPFRFGKWQLSVLLAVVEGVWDLPLVRLKEVEIHLSLYLLILSNPC
jgi:hypothetical protein